MDIMPMPQCHRCGKRHLSGIRNLELSHSTFLWTDPLISGLLDPDESQGFFSFGPTCARKVLTNSVDIYDHRNWGRYPEGADR
jgi:hypothetical protein